MTKPQIPKRIEERLDWLMQEMRSLHNRFDVHRWVQKYQPWNEDDPYRIECACGENREAAVEEFRKAEPKYDGY